MFPELVVDEGDTGMSQFMELVGLKADGHRTEDAVATIFPAVIEDRSECHHFPGTADVGNVHISPPLFPGHGGNPWVVGVDEAGLIEIEGDSPPLHIVSHGMLRV